MPLCVVIWKESELHDFRSLGSAMVVIDRQFSTLGRVAVNPGPIHVYVCM